MENKNILVIGAHLDDIEIGMGAMLFDLADPKKNNTIKYVVCSTGQLNHRINYPEKYAGRIEANTNNFRGLEGHVYQNAIDVNFAEHRFDLNRFIESSKELLFPDGVDIIFGPQSDLHNDHRIIKELVDIIARPDTGLEMYLMYNIPGSGKFNELYGSRNTASKHFFGFNSFKKKKSVLNRYRDCGILQKKGGLKSIKGIKGANKHWGNFTGRTKYAEQFDIGFSCSLESQ